MRNFLKSLLCVLAEWMAMACVYLGLTVILQIFGPKVGIYVAVCALGIAILLLAWVRTEDKE
ncbi:hypothetical protein DL1_11815 [Thioclava dalianensis]|uniref:Uncharacterized protein n=1 Tax=Thioclava dalianensis TaxID=1185766 RepID=A0A074T9E7_9RHOB|nr:hypothetical protein [Thioclava dalianensis]KEP68426.1 hypothetical protein DL1_11815 [Thioclava dalianensis]SFN61950.1 hypothetical protein SAMN05216224_10827 [Thioclava dalianensis]